MAKTYVTDKYSIEVKECEVVRETQKQIWFMAPRGDNTTFYELRESKSSEYRKHFKSMEDAIYFLIKRESDKAQYHKDAEAKHSHNASILIARLP